MGTLSSREDRERVSSIGKVLSSAIGSSSHKLLASTNNRKHPVGLPKAVKHFFFGFKIHVVEVCGFEDEWQRWRVNEHCFRCSVRVALKTQFQAGCRLEHYIPPSSANM